MSCLYPTLQPDLSDPSAKLDARFPFTVLRTRIGRPALGYSEHSTTPASNSFRQNPTFADVECERLRLDRYLPDLRTVRT
jgi:hypothetical protein